MGTLPIDKSYLGSGCLCFGGANSWEEDLINESYRLLLISVLVGRRQGTVMAKGGLIFDTLGFGMYIDSWGSIL